MEYDTFERAVGMRLWALKRASPETVAKERENAIWDDVAEAALRLFDAEAASEGVTGPHPDFVSVQTGATYGDGDYDDEDCTARDVYGRRYGPDGNETVSVSVKTKLD